MIIEVCDKLALHSDGWWMPHVCVAGSCALFGVFGGTPGRVVGAIAAVCWSSACLLLDLTDPIFPPGAISHELGLWTYALHLFGMLLPLVAMGLTVGAMRRAGHPS